MGKKNGRKAVKVLIKEYLSDKNPILFVFATKQGTSIFTKDKARYFFWKAEIKKTLKLLSQSGNRNIHGFTIFSDRSSSNGISSFF